jgi:hypothetical protein
MKFNQPKKIFLPLQEVKLISLEVQNIEPLQLITSQNQIEDPWIKTKTHQVQWHIQMKK